jgi:DNA-binding NtrC family response regulator
LPAAASDAPAPDELLPVIGASMARVVGILALFAEQEETLLLSGPTGSGKSRLARWCHARSARSGKAFETLDLSTVPEELQMAELVGWKRGAFTHAFKETPGALGRAEGGALFIDEIDKLSLKAQAGLLRILEDRRYRMLGEGAAEAVADVRFIAGTNANLSDLVSSGELRKDLYFRVNVLPVIVPPLVERRDEITAWAAYMLARRCKDGKDRPTAELSRGAKDILAGHPWPGNLRQLDNVVRRAHALAGRGRDVAKTLRITAEDVRSSLAYEIPAKPSLVELLHAAAVEFVEEAKRQRARGGLVDLDLADAFRGFVVAAATEREGIEQACRLLGREGAVKQRNQTTLVRHEVERAAALSSLVGGGLDASLVKVLALLEDDRDSGGLRSGRVS